MRGGGEKCGPSVVTASHCCAEQGAEVEAGAGSETEAEMETGPEIDSRDHRDTENVRAADEKVPRPTI